MAGVWNLTFLFTWYFTGHFLHFFLEVIKYCEACRSRVVPRDNVNIKLAHYIIPWGNARAQLVEALRYKPEGRGFDSRWYHWNFSLTKYFRPHYGSGVDSASNENEYQKYFLGGKGARCLRLTTSQLYVPTVIFIFLETSGPIQGLFRLFSYDFHI